MRIRFASACTSKTASDGESAVTSRVTGAADSVSMITTSYMRRGQPPPQHHLLVTKRTLLRRGPGDITGAGGYTGQSVGHTPQDLTRLVTHHTRQIQRRQERLAHLLLRPVVALREVLDRFLLIYVHYDPFLSHSLNDGRFASDLVDCDTVAPHTRSRRGRRWWRW